MKQYSQAEIKAIIQSMTPEEKVGQLFLLAFPGKDPEVIKPLIEKYGITGCYISQDNAETFDEARELSTRLQRMAAEVHRKLPLLLGVDQEGAWGVLVPESTTGPGNLALGAVRERSRVGDIYRIYGREMLWAGYNALLGPCADVNIDPNSPIIGTRSFGEFPGPVSQCVAEAVRGARGTGILTTLKHFPGHGGTGGDTHREIPRVEKSLEELLKTDLLPFEEGIKAGAEIIMTSHILYPQIDPDNPATLSSAILGDLLRNRLGFDGIILSDSMNMGAIREFYDPAESTLAALKAGIDVVMLSEEHYDHSEEYLPKQIASLELVLDALRSGRLDEALVDGKLERILDLKLNKMLIQGPELTPGDWSEHREIQAEAARESFVLLQKNLWPLPREGKIVCVNTTPRRSYRNLMNSRGIGPNQETPGFDGFKARLADLDPGVKFLDHEQAADAGEILARADALVLVTEDYPLPGEDFAKEEQRRLLLSIAREYSAKTVVLGLRSSYELKDYPDNITYLCGLSSRGCTAEAAARFLAERRTDAPGISPVTPRF